ncbi:hypothetical protein PVAND_009949 [Polypedilum vanderplanki]|uniref:Coiled-coil domain-containing protein 22 homolog n=1 Tax=Polypedilum vanderplanki TaxID=319348 RepID=A0A9J6CE38_POLVA|nr:hypothetical protein PVAND_009949 [Polypedilum vanderplanki]
MDEVDSIILETLREIGCELEEDVKLKNLSPEDVFKSISTLCKIISPESEIPKILPVQMAQRFSAASQLVDCCKRLGFNGDFGYQTILYSNINELRRVFMWLIENLPKSEDKTDSFQPRTVSKAKNIENQIARSLAIDLRQPWVLGFLQSPSNLQFTPIELERPRSTKKSEKFLIEYEEKFLKTIFHQTSSIIPSIIATHDIDLMKKNIPASESSEISKKLRSSMIRSTQSLNLMSASSKSTLSSMSNLAISEKIPEITQNMQLIQKSRVEILTEKVESLKEQIDEQEDIFKHLTFNKEEILKNIATEKENLERAKKNGKLKMQIAILLDNPEESIEKLQNTLEIAKQKRQTLNAKFESHKIPLEQQLEAFSSTNSVKLEKIKNIRETVKSMRQSMREIQEDIKQKVQLQQHLIEELNKMKRTTERSAYTSRIADIINSIKKQNYDINQVLIDTRALQKAINNIEGQLQRQFILTEELVWTKTAKQDEYSKKAYKLLISLHTEFSELIALIENTGSIQREIREIEDQIDNERQQNVQQKIDQITKDIQMIESSGSK